MAVSSKYTQDLSVQIVFFTFSCKWFLCFYFWAVIWSYIVDLFATLHELASASGRTLLKLASSVRVLLKPYGDTLKYVHNLNLRLLKLFFPCGPLSYSIPLTTLFFLEYPTTSLPWGDDVTLVMHDISCYNSSDKQLFPCHIFYISLRNFSIKTSLYSLLAFPWVIFFASTENKVRDL